MGHYVGLDAHVRTCTYSIKDEANVLVEQRTILSKPQDLLEVHARFPEALWIVEASSVHEWIYDTLTAKGAKVFAAHPRNILRAEGKKNDKFDSSFLIDAHRLGRLRPCYVPPPEIRRLRKLARRRAHLVQERTRAKNRIHGVLHRKGIKFYDDDDHERTRSVFTKTNRARLLAVDDDEIPHQLDIIDFFETKIAQADKEVQRAVDQDPAMQRLTTIPGFGALTSLVLRSEIGDAKRFAHERNFAAYVGLTPAETQSGDTLLRGHITSRGSGLCRWILIQAAWQHIRLSPESSISKSYRRVEKTAGKKRAIVMVARKLAVLAIHLLKTEQEFRINGRTPLCPAATPPE